MDYREQIQHALGTGFVIERELPGAGASAVFVAEELALARRVVVKMLPSKSAGGVNAERFEREIAVAARLQHPHLVPLLTAGVVSSNSVPWFSMPYVEGESLRELLIRRGPLPMRTVARLMREMASALAYAHARGVVHRDIKPENVLLSDDVSMISDFGVAMALDSAVDASRKSGRRLTGADTTLGTPAYSAPEQVSSAGTVDHRADLYAYGCVAYEMLAGAPPFDGYNLRDLLMAQIGQQPEPIDRHRSHIPPALARIVMRCLEKDPDNRPSSALDIVRALDDVPLSSINDTGETPAVSGGRAYVPSPASAPAVTATTVRPSRVPALSLIFAITFVLMVVVLIFG